MKFLAEILILCINLVLGVLWVLPGFSIQVSLNCGPSMLSVITGALTWLYWSIWFKKIRRHCFRKMFDEPP